MGLRHAVDVAHLFHGVEGFLIELDGFVPLAFIRIHRAEIAGDCCFGAHIVQCLRRLDACRSPLDPVVPHCAEIEIGCHPDVDIVAAQLPANALVMRPRPLLSRKDVAQLGVQD